MGVVCVADKSFAGTKVPKKQGKNEKRMHLIDRANPIQVIALQIGKIKWRKIFPLCSLHKEKVLRRQAPLTGFHSNHVLWRKIFPLCIHTIYTVRSH